LVVAKAAFIADPDQGRRSHVGVANWAFAVALIAETSDVSTRLLAAHYEIAATGCQYVYKELWGSLNRMEGQGKMGLTDDGETY
jgi:hypothetical protein